MRIQFKTLAIIGLIMAFISCKSSNQTTNTSVDKRGKINKRTDPSQMFAQMDTNKDGKISKVEAKGKM